MRCASIDPTSKAGQPRQCWHHGPHRGDHNFEQWAWVNAEDPTVQENGDLKQLLAEANEERLRLQAVIDGMDVEVSGAMQDRADALARCTALSEELARLREQVDDDNEKTAAMEFRLLRLEEFAEWAEVLDQDPRLTGYDTVAEVNKRASKALAARAAGQLIGVGEGKP